MVIGSTHLVVTDHVVVNYMGHTQVVMTYCPFAQCGLMLPAAHSVVPNAVMGQLEGNGPIEEILLHFACI